MSNKNQQQEETREVTNKMTIGQEIMRSNHGTPRSMLLKKKFADLFDELAQEAMDVEARAEKGPMIHSTEAIQAHMIVVAAAQETQRCLSEACKYLELGCMYAVKGYTA